MSQPPTTVLVIGDGQSDSDRPLPEIPSTYEVLTLQDERQILARSHGVSPDAIILELDGAGDRLNLLTQMQDPSGNPAPPILAIGDDDVEMAVQALKHGAVDYLVRDRISPEKLRSALDEAINKARGRSPLPCTPERFQISVENLMDCFGIFTAIRNQSGEIVDFRIDYLNAAACENNRMTRDMQIGRGLCEILPANRDCGLFEEYCRLVETGEPLVKDSLIYEDTYGGEPDWVRAYDIRATKLDDGFVASWRDITDRKRLEVELSQTTAALAQQQEQLQRLIDTAPIGIGIGTANGEVLAINDAMLRLHGFTRQEFEEQGMNWHQFTPPELAESIEQDMEQLRREGFLPPREKELLHRDGSRFPVWISAMGWMDNGDQHVAFAVDLTQQKQTEALLRESQARVQRQLAEQRAIYHSAPIGLAVLDRDLRFVRINERLAQINGLSVEAHLNRTVREVLPDLADAAEPVLRSILATGQPLSNVEIIGETPAQPGVERTWLEHFLPLFEGDRVIGINMVCEEITESKRREALLQATLQKLDYHVENSPLATIEWDRNFAVSRWSKGAERILGWQAEEVIGKRFDEFPIVYKADTEQVQTIVTQLSGGIADRVVTQNRNLTKTGALIHCEWYNSALLDETGHLNSVLSLVQDVSDRVAAEAALRQSEEQFRQLAENIVEAVFWISDLEPPQLIYVSPSYEHIWGRSRENLYANYDEWSAAIHPEDRQRIQIAIDRTRWDGFDQEYRIIRPDGSIRWIRDRGFPIRDRSGNPYRVVGMAEDITDRVAAEVALRESEARFRNMADNAPVMVWVTDQSAYCTYLSQSWYEFTGQTEATGLGFGWLDAVHPEDREASQILFLRANEHREAFAIEYRLRRRDGEYRYCIDTATPWFGENGEYKGYIGSVVDISDRRQVELGLQESEARLKLAHQATQSGLWDWDITRDRAYVSQEWCTLFGLDSDTGEIDQQQWLSYLHPDDRPKIAQIASRTIEQRQEYLEADYRILRADGIRWLAARGQVFYDATGNPVRMLGNVQDITERKQAELALRDAHIQLEAALSAGSVYTWRWNIGEDLVITDRNFAHLFGVDPEAAAAGLPIESFVNAIHPDDRPRITVAIQAAIATGEDYSAEYRIRNAEGEERWVIARGRVEYDTNGNPIAFPGAIADISDRKYAEETLRQNAARLEFILAATEFGTWEIDLRSQPYVAAPRSPKHDAIYGYSSPLPEWSYDTFIAHIHPDDRPRVEASFEQTITTYSDWQVECRIIRADSTLRWVWIGGSVYRDSEGQPLRLMGLIADISDRKEAEVALRESQQRLQMALEGSGGGLWVWDIPTDKDYLSPRWLEMLGYQQGELPQRSSSWEQLIHPEDKPWVLERLHAHLQDHSVPYKFEYRMRCQSGEWKWIANYGKVVSTDEQGNPLRLAGIHFDVSDRKRAEIALRDRETELRLITDAVPVLISFVDARERYRFNNRSYERWVGHSATETYGKTLREVLGEAAYTTIHPYVDRVLAGEQVTFECQIPNRDGERRYVEATYVPRFGDRGQVEGFVALVQDIHERKQAIASLEESEQRFRTLADNISQFAWMADSSGGIFWYNRRWFEYTGTTLEQMQGWGWRQVHHPDYVERVVEKISRCFATGEPWEDTFPLRSKEGEYRWFLSRALPIRDEAGNVTCWFGTNTDITDRQQVEAALRESEDRLRMAIESADLGTWDWNLVADELTWNAGCKAMFGLPPEAHISIETFFEALHPDEHDRLERVIRWSLNPASGGNYDVEYRIIGITDGIERWIAAKGQAYFDPAGKPLRFTGTVLDITAQKQVAARQEELFQREQAARSSAERANRIKDEFLAVLSHELRTPLNPILGWSRLLQTRRLGEDKTIEALAAIERNAQLQAQLIEDLLDVAKILRGKLSLNPTAVNLVSTIEGAIETVKTAAEAKSIAIDCQLPDIGQVHGDAARLQQIVWNLLSNAIKFTPEGGSVNVGLQRLEGRAQLTVSDTGKGIAPDFLPYLFESFRQEDYSTTRKFGGLGLGLAIVRYLVEAHGGEIQADSPGIGQGATFTVELPLLDRPDEGEPTEALPELEADLSGIRVLAVDDEPDTRALVAVLLGQSGAEVMTVASAVEVFSQLSSFQPDILVSDIAMPGIDGCTLIRRIRALPKAKGGEIPAIALSAYGREQDRQRAINSGYQSYITKPLKAGELVKAVATLVQSSDEK